jgi:hypothetical protein
MAPGSAEATTEKQKTRGSTAAQNDSDSTDGDNPVTGDMAELLFDENSKKRKRTVPGYPLGAGSLIRMMLSNGRAMAEKLPAIPCDGKAGDPHHRRSAQIYAYCMSFQVTAAPLYGGILLPLAIGAVVEGVATAFQTPLSGQTSPVLAVVPMGAFGIRSFLEYSRPERRRDIYL